MIKLKALLSCAFIKFLQFMFLGICVVIMFRFIGMCITAIYIKWLMG